MKDLTKPFDINGKTYYYTQGVEHITQKSRNAVKRWIHGQNERGITLKATRQLGVKNRPYIISEKDLKEFVLRWYNLGS